VPSLTPNNAVQSSILIVGKSESNVSLGADLISKPEEALKIIEQGNHSVYVLHLPITQPEKFNSAFRALRQKNLRFEVILHGEKIPDSLIEGLRIFKIESSENYDNSVKAAMERVQTSKQNQQLLQMIHDQNVRLLNLGKSLEERVDKRQAYLQKTHLSISETNKRGEAFQRALIAVHRSNSISEMERLLTEAIAEAFKINWIRIVLGQNRMMLDQIQKDRLQLPVHTSELKLQGEVLGSVSFGRKAQSFSRPEKDFFTQISDSIALALGRLKILRETEEIKMQWEATFNSITSPLALVSENYEVVRANGAFLKHPAAKSNKCYSLLMNRSSPCPNCNLGEKFRIDRSGEMGKVTILDVASQKISSQNVFVNIYRDISSQLQIETRIMESAKVAELGTIGSSIAHELNNPLGGIITFIQLIKMDLHGNEKFFSDIIALESAAQKCKEIIQNLLSFSRAPETIHPSEAQESLDLNVVVKRAIQIVELQSRSSEVEVSTELTDENLPLSANFGMITQSLMTYLQLAIESARGAGIQPIKLKIKTEKPSEKMTIFIISPKVQGLLSGPELLRRTIAERILSDLGANVEYSAEIEDQFGVKISFLPN
jgi:two-component system, NtrC family, sensor kinase